MTTRNAHITGRMVEAYGRVRSLVLQIRLVLKDWPLRNFLLLFLVYYLLATLAVIARYDFNPSSLIHFGHYYIAQNESYTPEGAVRLVGNEEHGGNGYDGQIFYYYARTLFLNDTWPQGFSHAYRAPRMGYPLLAAPFALFGSWGVVAGMIVVQIVLLAWSTGRLYRVLKPESRYLILFYILSPFTLTSYLLMVSNSITLALLVIGYSFMFYAHETELYTRRPARLSVGQAIPAFVCFSLAIFSKESALFFLFPLGLSMLLNRDFSRAAILIAILLPPFGWQMYLQAAHGMLPAGILSIFLSPLDGVYGVGRESLELLSTAVYEPGAGAVLALMKLSAKWLLMLLIVGMGIALFTGRFREWRYWFPHRAGIILVLFSVLIADYYYFWGIFDNIMRMFTLTVPLMILLKDCDASVRSRVFFGFLFVLTLFVFARILFLTPQFPFDTFHPYTGPAYEYVTPMP
ncbi:MAG: hypothetical protein KDK30_14130 [Leptospiraceae bacterium]|nr:hypothetical protein [Leptospiraceae bacterium]MCB1314454.1 hypothetical protein [Leptospiraceae bacterium]